MKISKIVYATLLAGSIGLNFYLLNEEVVVVDTLKDDIDLNQTQDKIKVSKAALKKISRTPSFGVETEKNLNEDEKLTPEDYDIAINEWDIQLDKFLEEELKLDRDQIRSLAELKRNRLIEIDNFLKSRIQESKTYYFSVEDQIAQSKINEKYLNKQRELLGESNYIRYKEYRSEYNRKLMETEGMYLLGF